MSWVAPSPEGVEDEKQGHDVIVCLFLFLTKVSISANVSHMSHVLNFVFF